MGGVLPWDAKLTDPKLVQQSKEDHMADIKKFLKVCFEKPPSAVESLLKYIKTLEFNDSPDYKKVHSILLAGLKEAGGTLGKPLLFGNRGTPQKRKGASDVAPTSPPKQARRGKQKLVESEEKRTNSSTEENKEPAGRIVNKRKAGKAGEVLQNGADKYNGYTPAMLEIAKKKEKQGTSSKGLKDPVPSTRATTTAGKRTLRTQQPVVYYSSPDTSSKKQQKKRDVK